MSQPLSFLVSGAVARITLSRPDKYNSINAEAARLFQQHLDACKDDDAVRAVMITGEGKAFCAGQDLAEASDPDAIDFETLVEEQYNGIIRRIRALEKPVVAAVNGVAAGAGANIALACDIVVASEAASFIQAFSKIALIPDSGGTFFLPRIVGLQRALALAMTGDKVPAAEALGMGMVYKVFPAEHFLAEAEAIATALAQMPTRALGLTKRLMNTAFERSLEEQLAAEKEAQAEAGRSADFREGVTAFLEKRKPVFGGK